MKIVYCEQQISHMYRRYLIFLFIIFIFSVVSLLVSCKATKYSKLENELIESQKLIDENKFDIAVNLLENSLSEFEKRLNKKEKIYTELTYQLAFIYDQLKNHKKAILYYLETISNVNINKEENIDLIIKINQRLGTLYRLTGNYNEAIKFLTKCLSAIESKYGKENKEYNKTLEIASITFKRMGDYNNAIHYNSKSTEIIKKLYGVDSGEYAISLTSLSQIYLEIGNYKEAQKLLENSMSILRNKEHKGIAYLQAIFTLSILHHNKYERHIYRLLA